jgi:hypothetical protein
VSQTRLADARARYGSDAGAARQLERVLQLLSGWITSVEGEYQPVDAVTRGRPLTLCVTNAVHADDLQAHVSLEQDELSDADMRDVSVSETTHSVGPRLLTVAVHSQQRLSEVRALITAQVTRHTGPLSEALVLSTVHGVLSSASDEQTLHELQLDNEHEITVALPKAVSVATVLRN